MNTFGNIEFFGPSGVGKSTLVHQLLNNYGFFNNISSCYSLSSCDNFSSSLEIVLFKLFNKTPVSLLRKNSVDFIKTHSLSVSQIWDLIYQRRSISFPGSEFLLSNHFFNSFGFLNLLNNSRIHNVLIDESLIQRAFGIGFNLEDKLSLFQYLKLSITLSHTHNFVYVTAAPDRIMHQILNRPRSGTHFLKTDDEIYDFVLYSLKLGDMIYNFLDSLDSVIVYRYDISSENISYIPSFFR